MAFYITANIIAILAFAVFIGFLSREGERLEITIWSLWLGFCLSVWGWIIFVVVHFATKYW